MHIKATVLNAHTHTHMHCQTDHLREKHSEFGTALFSFSLRECVSEGRAHTHTLSLSLSLSLSQSLVVSEWTGEWDSGDVWEENETAFLTGSICQWSKNLTVQTRAERIRHGGAAVSNEDPGRCNP